MTKPPLKRPPTKGTRRGNGVGQGEGWGGPKKGFVKTQGAKFEPGNEAAVGRAQPDWERLQTEAEQAAALRRNLLRLSFEAENEAVQKAASEALLNRIEGLPVSRQQQLGADGNPTDPAAINVMSAAMANLSVPDLKALIALYRRMGVRLPHEPAPQEITDDE